MIQISGMIWRRCAEGIKGSCFLHFSTLGVRALPAMAQLAASVLSARVAKALHICILKTRRLLRRGDGSVAALP